MAVLAMAQGTRGVVAGPAGRGLAIRSGRRRFSSLCALVLLSVIALSFLHTASTHCGVSQDCLACRTLHTPALAQPSEGLSQPQVVSDLVIEPGAAPARDCSLNVKPLRAPPLRTV